MHEVQLRCQISCNVGKEAPAWRVPRSRILQVYGCSQPSRAHNCCSSLSIKKACRGGCRSNRQQATALYREIPSTKSLCFLRIFAVAGGPVFSRALWSQRGRRMSRRRGLDADHLCPRVQARVIPAVSCSPGATPMKLRWRRSQVVRLHLEYGLQGRTNFPWVFVLNVERWNTSPSTS